MTGLLVVVVMLLFVCAPSSASWADTAPGLQNRVAQADNSQIVPPDPEQPAEAPAASSAADAAAEVLRLRDLIGEKRDEIEAGRSAAMEQVEATYRANLAAIESKDMFETELEYQQRDAREKSEVELQRARDVSGVHREHDLALSDEVEPMVQQVRELLSRDDIVPAGAIDANLENYDAERNVFTGTLKIDSALVQTNARIYLPMKRDKARILWKNRAVLQGKIRVSMNVRSLDIGIEEFWFENPESGSRTEERIAINAVRIPARMQRVGAKGGPSSEQLRAAQGFRSSVSALAKRASNYGGGSDAAKGLIAEYNRLIEEAKSVFTKDPHVQAMRALEYVSSDARYQAAGAVARAASGLEAYLASFVSNEAFKVSASALAKWASKRGSRDNSIHTDIVNGWIAEYNRLIEEAKSVFTKDPHVQAMRALEYVSYDARYQGAGAVATAASGLETYLVSFASNEAFKVSVSVLAKRASNYGGGSDAAKGLIAEYNRLIEEAKSVFTKDPHVQAMRALEYVSSDARYQAAGAVARAASGLEAYLASFVSNEAFKVSASALAKWASKRGSRDNSIHTDIVNGWIAEYNRLIEEAKSVFTKDPHVQAMRALEYVSYDARYQGAGAVATAAGRLQRIMENIKETPR